jgi:shikimate dehydrogenase
MEMIVKGTTNIYAVIGNPVKHTVSPAIHNTLSKTLRHDNIYIPLKIEKDKFNDAIEGMKAVGIKGFNITVPYKNDIIKHLDSIDRNAELTGSVNTVKIEGDKLHGYSTDGEGFLKSFRLEAGTGFKNKRIVLLGAGGTTRALGGKLVLENPYKISIINRTYEKALHLKEMLNDYAKKECVEACKASESDDIIKRADIIINTTSVGMHPHTDASPVTDRELLLNKPVIYDVIYRPEKTKLLKMGESMGCKVINGLGMLMFQAVAAYEIWNDIRIDDDTSLGILKSLAKEIYEKESI